MLASRIRVHSRAQPGTRASGTAGALDRAQLRDLESELLAERARLERSLGEVLDSANLTAGERRDAGSVPGEHHDVDGLRRDGVHARLDAVGAALDRMSDGTYGRCAMCGNHIPFGRLLVLPASEHCVTCAARA